MHTTAHVGLSKIAPSGDFIMGMAALPSFDWASRAKAAAIHLLASVAVAAVTGTMVFTLWFPWPYRTLAGGTELFLLLVGVDVVIGPLITLAVFDRRKPSHELRRDLGIVVLLQLAALVYGAHVTFQARPVVLALEVDRFRVVPANAVVESELPQAIEALRRLPLDGPRTVATVQPTDEKERFDSIAMAMGGADLGMRPRYWRPWDEVARRAGLAHAKPLAATVRRPYSADSSFGVALRRAGKPVEALRFLPLLARQDGWVVLLAADSGEIVGFAPINEVS